MAIPDFQTAMLPLLKLVADKKVWKVRDAVDCLADQFQLTPDERSALLPSGGALVFSNRVAWARTYMAKAALLRSPARGQLQITERGIELLSTHPLAISIETLSQYPEFVAFREGSKPTSQQEGASSPTLTFIGRAMVPVSPQESLEQAHSDLTAALNSDVVELLKTTTPVRFEQIVVDVITSMGYGGSRQEAGKAIGKSGDEGIDGIINEDRLGLDTIYLQAKRWENPVGRPEIQKFVGALAGQQASKGIFITTSVFTKEADDYARKIPQKVILVNGAQLARLMIEHNVGVSTVATYELKKVDSDYFAEE